MALDARGADEFEGGVGLAESEDAVVDRRAIPSGEAAADQVAVMVSQDAKTSQASAQAGEQALHDRQGGEMVVLGFENVAGDEDQVWRFVGDALQQVVIGRVPMGAKVQIREVQEAQAGEVGMEIWDWKVEARPFEAIGGEDL